MITPESNLTLRDYWEVLKRRRNVFATAFAIIVLLALVVTFASKPLYRATTTIIVEPDTREISNFSPSAPLDYSREFYETQYEIMRCNTVIQRVFNACGLDKDPAFSGRRDPLEAFRRRISVSPAPNSRIVRLSVEHRDRPTAIRLADTLARVYIEYNTEHRQTASRSAFEWLTTQITQLKEKVETSQKSMLQFKTQDDAVSVEKRKALLEDRLTSLSKDYNEVVNKNIELETTLNEIAQIQKRPEMVESLPRILDSTLIQNLKEQLSGLSVELAKVSGKFKPKHPTVLALESQIAIVRGRLSGEAAKIYKSLEIDFQISKAKEKALKESLDQVKLDSMKLAGESIEYGSLQREAESNQQIYDVLLKRLAEAGVGGNMNGQNIRVLDPATSDSSPYKPRKSINILVGTLSGLLVGIALAFAAEQIDNTLKTEKDVSTDLGIPVLALIPKEKIGPKLIESPPETLRIAYTSLKSSIALYSRDHQLRTLLVTSAVRSEGKTVSSASLALAIAGSGQKVLLVDADLFGPRLGKIFGLQKETGITDYFSRDLDPLDLIQPTGVANLDIIPAGLIPRNPSEFFGSPKMLPLINAARDRYSIIIVDSPPLSASIEVALLGAAVDGVLFVVKANSTPRPFVRKMIGHLRGVKANLIGVALTSADVSAETASYYYNYSQYKTPEV